VQHFVFVFVFVFVSEMEGCIFEAACLWGYSGPPRGHHVSSRAEVKNEWRYISTPPYASFTFTLTSQPACPISWETRTP